MGSRISLVLTTVLVVGLGSCSNGESSSSAGEPQPSAAGSSPEPPYETQHFMPAMTVEPPSWLPPEPALDEEHLLTWVGTGPDVDRAVRFVSPVGLYDPALHPGRLSPLPKDYVTYLLGLSQYGAHISAPTTLDVDGHPATVVTASTETGLGGSLGCQATDLSPEDCFGLQEFALLRLAVIDVDGTTLLAWARTVPGSPDSEHDFAALEDLLGDVRFR
jgi:hypothetical protein